MWHAVVAVLTLICAIQAVRSDRLLVSALWLAGTSALVALEMYMLGSPEVAVVELSVGAGLVTVLFVFAINLTGDERGEFPVKIPKAVSLSMILAAVVLIAWFTLRYIDQSAAGLVAIQLSTAIWKLRQLDMMLQILLVFCGVLGVVGLLGDVIPVKGSRLRKEEKW